MEKGREREGGREREEEGREREGGRGREGERGRGRRGGRGRRERKRKRGESGEGKLVSGNWYYESCMCGDMQEGVMKLMSPYMYKYKLSLICCHWHCCTLATMPDDNKVTTVSCIPLYCGDTCITSESNGKLSYT